MSNITTTGTTSYPSGVDTRTSVTNDPNGTEVRAEHINGVSAAIIAVETELGVTPKGTMADLSARLAVLQNTDGTLKSTVIQGGTGATIVYNAGVFTVSYGANAAQFNQNLGIVSTVAGNAFTVSLTDQLNFTPSSISAVLVPFRNVTLVSGTYEVRSIDVATQLTLPAGGTLGFANSQAGRIYHYIIDSTRVGAPAAELAMARRAIFSESILQTTTAISAVSHGDAILYSATARSGVPIRLVGFTEITTGGTAGNWSNTPTTNQIYGPGVWRTGDVVQAIQSTTGVGQAASTQGYNNALNPTSPNGGTRWFSVVMTPTSVINTIRATGSFEGNANGTLVTAALFSTAQDHAHLVRASTIVADDIVTLSLIGEFPVLSITSTTWFVMGNGVGSSTVRLNQNSGGAQYGGANQSSLTIEEIQA